MPSLGEPVGKTYLFRYLQHSMRCIGKKLFKGQGQLTTKTTAHVTIGAIFEKVNLRRRLSHLLATLFLSDVGVWNDMLDIAKSNNIGS